MASGWVAGEPPATEGATVDTTAYFHFDGNPQYSSAPVRITNCGDFYVYFLGDAPTWDFGYCTMD